MALGVSFFPQPQAPNQQQPQAGQPVQQALQMLSLRVPRFASQGALLPQQLQQRQPGSPLGPIPGTPEWDELMRRLMGGMPPMQQPLPGGGPQQPPPLPPIPDWTYKGPAVPPDAPGQVKPPKLPTFLPSPMPGAPPPPTAGPGPYWPGPGTITKQFDYLPDQKQY